jgi:hypothetical protein
MWLVSTNGSGRNSRASKPRDRLVGARRLALGTVLAVVVLLLSGCGGSHQRTELLQSANPLTSDISVQINGPGGAVSYVGQRFITAGDFGKYDLRKDPKGGFFVPPRIRDHKLCASTHVIRLTDAPQLQKWRGRTLAVTVYGKKSSTIFCAVLGPGLYQADS